MAEVPVTIACIIYPKDKTDAPYPATIRGYASITGLEIGGGPILPPDEVPPVDPPWVVWPPLEHPAHPIVMPPDLPPVQPPPGNPPWHEGWNWSVAKSGWYHLSIPSEGEATPKRR